MRARSTGLRSAGLKTRRYGVVGVIACAVALVVGEAGLQTRLTAQAQQSPQPGLFPPVDLGLLERPDRALWQKPDQIMDAVNVADGSTVADIGAGAGWFTMRLAQQVGPNGLVYAQDVQHLMLDAIKRRVQREGLQNVRTIQAHENDPNLPTKTFDAILMVDAYQEVKVENRVVYLRNLAHALKPKGRIGIVNWKPGRGGPGPDEPNERVERSVVEADAKAAGLRVVGEEDLRYQYLLVLAP